MYVNSSGDIIELGRRLGTGGEGVVYELPKLGSGYVGKIYRKPLSPSKQEKLLHMVKAHNPELDKISTWPLDTLSDEHRSIKGFVMRKLDKYEPIHLLYSPAHRKQVFPKANWAFLINTARNLAAAFHVIHLNGHVVGDVNQGNVYVSSDSTVRLIDCDSFQVSLNGKTYKCEVGNTHFTPPEMQTIISFHEFSRTESQDVFGLAVLCFHLLFMGRHPFSGVHSCTEFVPIETAIQRHQFAFGKHSQARGISPPPNCVTMDIIPQEVATLFEMSFSEESARLGSRPPARVWFTVLDNFKKNLVTCGTEHAHVYYNGLNRCPWCRLEEGSGVLFFVGTFDSSPQTISFNVELIWKRITSIQSPGPPPTVNLTGIPVTPKPLPTSYKITRIKVFCIRAISVSVLVISTASAIVLECV
jgi:DNA-binding helix-hairpin-helix protein with protein kinase domain